jgi:ribonuclease T2
MSTFLVLANLLALALASPLEGLLLSPNQQSVLLGQSTTSSCPISGPISCHRASNPNRCCFESPGGLLSQTQFWDTQPTTGPSNSWTIHGLWPDHCDGTFDHDCDPSRAYGDIRGLLDDNGASDTVSFMDTYWVNINGDNDELWNHEWSKHGTCFSTLRPECLTDRSIQGAEAIAFFQRVVRLFQTLPTYDWLANAGITPSRSKKYTLDELTSALQSASGYIPALDCKHGVLNGASYYYNLRGSVIDGTFIPIDAPKSGTCPSNGIAYHPK